MNLSQIITNKYPDFFREWDCRLRIDLGQTNQIRFVEHCSAIDSIDWVLKVTLKSDADLSWLENEIVKCQTIPGFAKAWIDENTFADRKAINERYGF